MRDIYTGKPIAKQSSEHVIPDAIGGRLESVDLIDKTTNDQLGGTIDAALADSLLVIRSLIDGKSGSGRTAPLLRGLRGADGLTYDLRAGGLAELGEQKISFEERDSELIMHVKVRDKAELQRLAERAAAKRGVTAERFAQSLDSIVVTKTPAPAMQIDFKLGPEFWRAVAKIACNMFALERRDLFLDESFDAIRSFVLSGGNDTWSFVAMNCQPLMIGDRLGDLDHLVIVRGDAGTGEVRALVILYGFFEFVVRVGFTRLADDFSTAYRVNQIVRTDRIDAADDNATEVPVFERLTATTQQRWLESHAMARDNAMLVAHKVADRRAIAHVARLVAQDFSSGYTWVSDAEIQASMLRHLDEHYPLLAARWRASRSGQAG